MTATGEISYLTSDDAITWVRARSGTHRELRAVATDGHTSIAVGGRIMLTSLNGRDWNGTRLSTA